MRCLNNVPAPAKLNLFLLVNERRDDGYHNLQTLFRLIDYSDYIDFSTRSDGEVYVHCEGGEIDEDSNLVKRATMLLKEATGTALGVDICLYKRIPLGSGLGGGSSDAATTLRALNLLWDCHLSIESLCDLGFSLGADVPVFINGYSAWAEGAGERLTSITLPDAWYLVLIPQVQVMTADLFAMPELTRSIETITIDDYRSGHRTNVFKLLVKRRFPQVAKVIDWLDHYCSMQGSCLSKAQLSGTGCGVFAEFTSQQQALEAFANKPDDINGFVAHGLNTSPLSQSLKMEGVLPAKGHISA